MDIILRKEIESDYRMVEEITRDAFWNVHVPGCTEHYLVHVMRDHKDFIQDLDYVALVDDHIVGSIMSARSRVINEEGRTTETVTFGPVSVLPEYQRKGIGSALIRHTVQKAKENHFAAIIIYGNPGEYCRHGFRSSKDFDISTPEGKFPYGLLVRELEQGVLNNHSWKFHESDVYNVEEGKAEEFDKFFPYKEKEFQYTQEEFKIACRAYVE